jgi:type IV pilus assembly protein PilY1
MVFVGANDGMLHAFKLGTVKLFEEKFKKAELSGTNLGEEMWAYIPKHALPYLKYTADPNYCHLYFVDAAPHLFDVSIGGNPGDQINVSSWRTVLIGGMRFGGACRDSVSPYSVQTPAPGIGYSSYFALDITETLTDPSKPPEVLWEFSDEDIARFFPEELETGWGLRHRSCVARIGLKGKNGRWFVVFGSGPTGPIDTLAHQFKGYSDQSLKLFIIDLKNGPSPGNIWKLNSGIPNAFAGSLIGAPIDLDQNNASSSGFYQDDAIYFGYTQAEGDPAASRWSKGGVLRLVTKEADPSRWVLSTVVNNIGPVTSTVSKLQNYKTGDEALWLFFGTGRYFYKIGALIDDADSSRKVYGIKEPCFDNDPGDHPKKLDPDCTRTLSEDDLGDVTKILLMRNQMAGKYLPVSVRIRRERGSMHGPGLFSVPSVY